MASRWLRSALPVRSVEQPLFLGAHGVRDVADRARRYLPRGGLAQQVASRAGDAVSLDELHFPRELVEPRFDRRAAIA